MARFDPTDFEWTLIRPRLANKPRGVARVDDRRVLKELAGKYPDSMQVIDSSIIRAH